MIRATTPTHTFTFPEEIDPSECRRILVTYYQSGKQVLELTESDLLVEGQDIKHTFTQDETNLFCANSPAKVQVRILLESEEALASDIMPFDVKPVLNDEVLT